MTGTSPKRPSSRTDDAPTAYRHDNTTTALLVSSAQHALPFQLSGAFSCSLSWWWRRAGLCSFAACCSTSRPPSTTPAQVRPSLPPSLHHANTALARPHHLLALSD